MENNIGHLTHDLWLGLKSGAVSILAYFATIHFGLLLAVVIMGALDVIIGVRNAKRQGKFRSRKMRDGIIDKFYEVLIVVLSALAEYSIIEALSPVGITFLPLTNLIAVGLIWKDYGSIIETRIDSGADVPEFILKAYAVGQKKINEAVIKDEIVKKAEEKKTDSENNKEEK